MAYTNLFISTISIEKVETTLCTRPIFGERHFIISDTAKHIKAFGASGNSCLYKLRRVGIFDSSSSQIMSQLNVLTALSASHKTELLSKRHIFLSSSIIFFPGCAVNSSYNKQFCKVLTADENLLLTTCFTACSLVGVTW